MILRLRIKRNSLNTFLSTINFVLCFVGIQLATSMFLPTSSNIEGITVAVTIPYRAFALLISLVVIMINFFEHKSKYSKPLIVFLIFWGLYIIRILYDFYIRTDLQYTNGPDISKILTFVFLVCMPSYYSIIRSYKHIDLEKSFWWILALTSLTLVFTLFTNQSILVTDGGLERLGGNAAMSTIAFGHFGATCIILGFYTLVEKKTKLSLKLLLVTLIILGTFSMLRAGSNGPVLALVVVLIFWSFSRKKNFLRGFVSIIGIGILLILFIYQIFELIANISPLIAIRLKSAIFYLNTNGRDIYYISSFKTFLEGPIFGKQLLVLLPNGSYDYSHNLILDALMGLGIVGGGMILYVLGSALKKSYLLINRKDPQFWISLLLIQQIVLNMVSGAFYYNQLLSVLITFLFLYYIEKEKMILKNQVEHEEIVL